MTRRSLYVAHALIQFGLWLLIAACITPADAAEAVTPPWTAHGMQHVCVVGLLVGAAAVVVVIGRRVRL